MPRVRALFREQWSRQRHDHGHGSAVVTARSRGHGSADGPRGASAATARPSLCRGVPGARKFGTHNRAPGGPAAGRAARFPRRCCSERGGRRDGAADFVSAVKLVALLTERLSPGGGKNSGAETSEKTIGSRRIGEGRPARASPDPSLETRTPGSPRGEAGGGFARRRARSAPQKIVSEIRPGEKIAPAVSPRAGDRGRPARPAQLVGAVERRAPEGDPGRLLAGRAWPLCRPGRAGARRRTRTAAEGLTGCRPARLSSQGGGPAQRGEEFFRAQDGPAATRWIHSGL